MLDYVEHDAASHGLNPEAYAPAALRRAIEREDFGSVTTLGERSFRMLARDLRRGVVPAHERHRAHFAEPDRLEAEIDAALAMARSSGAPGNILDGLAPRHPQYDALRQALRRAEAMGDEELRQAIAINLERWRWLPRDLGSRYIIVNIPEYSLYFRDQDSEEVRHRVIVGKSSTATPQFAAQVEGVILNPSWSVPQSIIAESVGRLIRTNPSAARARGYTWSRDANGRLRVVQKPGPGNALGVIKLDMPNRFTVYAHDTPSKQLFDEPVRTFSHGCIRVDDAVGLAKALLGAAGGHSDQVDGALEAGSTRRVQLPTPIPIYIVYFTVVAGPDGGIARLADPYNLDGMLAERLPSSTAFNLTLP